METPQSKLLAHAAGSSEALSGLLALKKAENPKFSLSSLCRLSGLTSKGNLCDVLAGRRVLHPRHGAGMARALGLGGTEKRLFQALVLRDRAKTHLQKVESEKVVQGLRRSVEAPKAAMPGSLSQSFFAIEVFCALGLFGNQANEEQLVSLYGPARRASVRTVLKLLVKEGYLEETAGEYRPLSRVLSFTDSDDGLSHIRFLEMALDEAKRQARAQYAKASQCFFESNLISVRKSDYLKALGALKEDIRVMEGKLETGDGDALIRFNVQVYPILDRSHSSGILNT